jgi:hypothetical protein
LAVAARRAGSRIVNSSSFSSPAHGAVGTGWGLAATVKLQLIEVGGASAAGPVSSSTARVKVAVPSSALVGVHTTVWVNASKRAERGIAVTSTRTSSRS